MRAFAACPEGGLAIFSPADLSRYLAVGASGDGPFVVYTTSDGVNFWNLLNGDRNHHERVVRLRIGADESDYRAAQIVRFEMAMEAARVYCQTGRRAATMVWAVA